MNHSPSDRNSMVYFRLQCEPHIIPTIKCLVYRLAIYFLLKQISSKKQLIIIIIVLAPETYGMSQPFWKHHKWRPAIGLKQGKENTGQKFPFLWRKNKDGGCNWNNYHGKGKQHRAAHGQTLLEPLENCPVGSQEFRFSGGFSYSL